MGWDAGNIPHLKEKISLSGYTPKIHFAVINISLPLKKHRNLVTVPKTFFVLPKKPNVTMDCFTSKRIKIYQAINKFTKINEILWSLTASLRRYLHKVKIA